MKCSLKGLALEPRLTVSQSELLFGEVASHNWADQNLVLANQGSSLPLRFSILPCPYFHCLPDQGSTLSQQFICTCSICQTSVTALLFSRQGPVLPERVNCVQPLLLLLLLLCSIEVSH